MQVTLDKLKPDHRVRICNQQQKIICPYQKFLQKSQSEIIFSQLNALFESGKEQLKVKFKNSVDSQIQLEWIQSFYPDIESQNKRLHTICVDRVRKDIANAKQESQKLNFKELINLELKQLYQKDKSLKQIQDSVNNKAKILLGQITKQIDILNHAKKQLGNNKISINIQRFCEKQLANYFKESKDSGLRIKSLQEEYQNIQKLLRTPKNESSIKHLIQFFGSFNWIGFDSTLQVYDAFGKYIKNSKNLIITIVQKSNFTILQQIQPLITKIIESLKISFQQLPQSIMQITNSLKKAGFIFKKSRQHIIGRFIASLPKIIQFHMIINCLDQKHMEMALRLSIVQERLNQVKQSFQAKGNNEMTADNWINKIVDSIIEKHYKKSLKTIQSCLDNVNANLNPQKLIENAINQSIDSPSRLSKDRMIKCFKLTTNINRFIKQLVYSEAEIKDLTQKIDLQRQNIVTLTKNDIIALKDTITEPKNNYSKDKKIKHYADLFKIDLSLYKSSDFDSSLSNILLLMTKKIDSELNTFINRSLKLINKKRDFLQLQSRNYLKQKIQPSVIGCQARCPFCKMKCKKSDGHSDGHQVVKGTHVLVCFAGFSIAESHIRSNKLCYTQEMQNVLIKVNEDYIPFMDWIEQNHLKWHNHFSLSNFSGIERKIECQFIWQNIGDMLIKYSFQSTIIVNDVEKGEYALTDKDITENKLDKYYQNE